jgi:hypothetical protein
MVDFTESNEEYNLLLWLSRVLKGFLLVGLGVCLFGGHNFNVFLIGFILAFTIIPHVIWDVYIPVEIEFATVLFLFASIFLGTVHGWYEQLWWWDLFLHLWSGVLLGILGFLLVYLLNESERVTVSLNPFFVVLFSFSFAVTIGVFWEFIEFGLDQTFGLMSQQNSLVDTMGDLLVDAVGALLVSVTGYMWLKYNVRTVVSNTIERIGKTVASRRSRPDG